VVVQNVASLEVVPWCRASSWYPALRHLPNNLAHARDEGNTSDSLSKPAGPLAQLVVFQTTRMCVCVRACICNAQNTLSSLRNRLAQIYFWTEPFIHTVYSVY
jgi:hypothetical protein